MTDDYKKTLLNYLCGTLKKENPVGFGGYEKTTNIDKSVFNGYIPEVTESWINFEGIVPYKDKIVLYGGFIDTNNNDRGLIIVCNSDFTPEKTYYTYENGTYLRYVQQLNVTTDGMFYMIDSVQYTPATPGEGEKRLVLLNNFVSNNKLNLQKSYIFPQDYRNFYAQKIFKDENSGNYVFIGLKDTEIGWNLKVIHFKTTVGQPDEWRTWEADTNTAWLFGDGYAEFNDDGEPFIQLIINAVNVNDKNIILWKKDYTDDLLKASVIMTPDYKTYIDSEHYRNQAIFMNKNEVYFILNNQIREEATNKHLSLYYYNFLNNELKIIFDKSFGTYEYINKEAMYINKNQGEVYAQYNDEITAGTTANYKYATIKDFTFKASIIATNATFTYDSRMFYVSNVYNLVNLYMVNVSPNVWNAYNVTKLYNPNNYNDYSYTNVNSLVPKFINLYDSNNNILFSRNLYNKTISGGTTQSTIQIPNTYLNDKIITKEDLQSETNMTNVSATQTIQKNIYETLNINFINTISMINKNDENNVIVNPAGASRINDSVSDKTDYDNAKALKVKIIKSDDTSFIKTLEGSVVEAFYDGYLSTLIYVPTDKTIKEIQILSNDEQTIYQVITNPELTSGKVYHITQVFKIK